MHHYENIILPSLALPERIPNLLVGSGCGVSNEDEDHDVQAQTQRSLP
jgi:hypothetical protein